MQINLGMRVQESLDRRALARREVIRDHVDLFTVQPVGDDICEEGDELSRGVPCTEQQDQAYTTRLIGASRLACGSLCQFHLFHFRQRNRAANEHEFARF